MQTVTTAKSVYEYARVGEILIEICVVLWLHREVARIDYFGWQEKYQTETQKNGDVHVAPGILQNINVQTLFA